uniref:BPTI/Kunitz inhibitor domain-containing protein n=1 Tax=Panagrolaimus superbus TaxID=310955 RepID=A0A914Z7D3_9BILA
MRSFFSVLTLLVVITVAYGYPPFICTLPRDRGNGIQRLINFYYDPATNDCVEFLFYGRGGNRNRFFSKKKCINFCRVNITLTLPDAIQQQPETASTILPNSVSASETTCNLPLPPPRDWPKNSKTAYAFDSKANQCFYVYYDEETLNANNFPTREACLAFCGDASPTEQQFTQAICSLPPPPTKEWPQ